MGIIHHHGSHICIWCICILYHSTLSLQIHLRMKNFGVFSWEACANWGFWTTCCSLVEWGRTSSTQIYRARGITRLYVQSKYVEWSEWHAPPAQKIQNSHSLRIIIYWKIMYKYIYIYIYLYIVYIYILRVWCLPYCVGLESTTADPRNAGVVSSCSKLCSHLDTKMEKTDGDPDVHRDAVHHGVMEH